MARRTSKRRSVGPRNKKATTKAKAPSSSRATAIAAAKHELIARIRLDKMRRGVLLHRKHRQRAKLPRLGSADPQVLPASVSWIATDWLAPAITIYIDDLRPQTLLEGRIARVHFGVCNTTSEVLSNLSVRAVVRPQFFPSHINNVAQYDGLVVWDLPDLQPWDLREGVVTFEIPPASDRTQDQPPPNEIEVILSQYVEPTSDQIAQAAAMGYEILGSWRDLGSDKILFDSGSRYRLALTGISIQSIASFETDTVVVGLGGSINGADIVPQSAGLGDHGESRAQIPVPLNGVGYFTSISAGGDDQYTLTYGVANSGGDSIDDLREALNWISRIAGAVAVIFTAGATATIWPLLDEATEYFNNSLIRDCNRLIGTGSETFGPKDLFDITWQELQTGASSPLPPLEWKKPTTNDNSKACGTADYFLVRTVFRDRSGMEFVLLQPAGSEMIANTLVTKVPYGGTLNLDELVTLTPGNLILKIGGDKRMWTIERGEGTINKGTYIAPDGPVPGDIAGFAVINLTLLRQNAISGNGYIVVRYS